jgi:hypothetical protein
MSFVWIKCVNTRSVVDLYPMASYQRTRLRQACSARLILRNELKSAKQSLPSSSVRKHAIMRSISSGSRGDKIEVEKSSECVVAFNAISELACWVSLIWLGTSAQL